MSIKKSGTGKGRKLANLACVAIVSTIPVVCAQTADSGLLLSDNHVERALMKSGVFSGNMDLTKVTQELLNEQGLGYGGIAVNDSTPDRIFTQFRYGEQEDKLKVALDEKTPLGLYKALKMENYIENVASNKGTDQEVLLKIARSGKATKNLLENPNVKGELYRIAVSKMPKGNRDWYLQEGFKSGKIVPKKSAPGFEGEYYAYWKELRPAYDILRNPRSKGDNLQTALNVVKKYKGTNEANKWNSYVNQINQFRAKMGEGTSVDTYPDTDTSFNARVFHGSDGDYIRTSMGEVSVELCGTNPTAYCAHR